MTDWCPVRTFACRVGKFRPEGPYAAPEREKRMKRALVLLIALLTALALAVPVSAGVREKSALFEFETGEATRGFTSLKRNVDSVDVSVHVRELTPGNAETLWAVVFNNPDGCSAPGCGEDDIFDDSPDGFNDDGIAAAKISVFWAGFGGVANGGGNLNGNITIQEEVSPGQVLFGPGLLDAEAAEIHFVVQDHGASTGNPLQTTTFMGDCNPDCADIQFSIHK